MNVKLTLKLDQKVVDTAKQYALGHQTSLSKLVEHYFKRFDPKVDNGYMELTPIVAELSGAAKHALDGKDDYVDYLNDKYS